jgi:hypothetical protein
MRMRGGGEGVKEVRVVKREWWTFPHSQECENVEGTLKKEGKTV